MRITHLLFGIGLIGLLLVFGCLSQGQDNLYNYNGVTVVKDDIPDTCLEKTDCAMFECMVSQCWCMPSEISGQPASGVLYKSNTKVQSEEEAKTLVANYLNSKSIAYGQITKAVKLNAIFYNVFYEPSPGDEEVLTVAVDATILKTACGV